MYDFVDRRISNLDAGGRFLIWSMRNWVMALNPAQRAKRDIAPAFLSRNLAAGLPHFNAMMAAIRRSARETFIFGPLGCRHVREHEALILSLVYGMCMSSPDKVRATLELIVQEEAVAEVMTAVAALGRAMAEAGIFPGKPAPVAANLPGRPETRP